MRDLDNFNSLEERALRLEMELEERCKAAGGNAGTISGIDERSERKANELENEAWERARNGEVPFIDDNELEEKL
jgi:hypothetical protein